MKIVMNKNFIQKYFIRFISHFFDKDVPKRLNVDVYIGLGDESNNDQVNIQQRQIALDAITSTGYIELWRTLEKLKNDGTLDNAEVLTDDASADPIVYHAVNFEILLNTLLCIDIPVRLSALKWLLDQEFISQELHDTCQLHFIDINTPKMNYTFMDLTENDFSIIKGFNNIKFQTKTPIKILDENVKFNLNELNSQLDPYELCYFKVLYTKRNEFKNPKNSKNFILELDNGYKLLYFGARIRCKDEYENDIQNNVIKEMYMDMCGELTIIDSISFYIQFKNEINV